VIDRVAGKVALHVRAGIKTERPFVKQLRFIDVNRNSGDPVVAVKRVLIEMEIVERVALIQRQASPRSVLLFAKQDALKQLHFQTGFDPLVN